jgi:hypothetical protein
MSAEGGSTSAGYAHSILPPLGQALPERVLREFIRHRDTRSLYCFASRTQSGCDHPHSPAQLVPGWSLTAKTLRSRFYYTVHPNGGLVFAEAGEAEHIHRIHFALENSKTWADFRRLMPTDEYAKIMEILEENLAGDPAPSESDPFDGGLVPGYYDGDYPKWLQQSMHETLPAELLERFAIRESSVLNGPYWSIDEAHERAIVSELRRLGHTVERRDDLSFQ